MADFTFLHAADIHLGSPFRGLSVREPAVARGFAQATRDAFANLVDTAVARRVAFVVIAGDLYDREPDDSQLGLFFNREVAKLDRAGIPLFLLRGNHDAESIVTRSVSMPASVRVFPNTKPETFELPHLRVALHGRGFKDAAVTENFVPDYPEGRSGWFDIGVLHTSLSGSGAHDTYAPCSLEDLRGRAYDYWALGHIHKPETVSTDPPVVYPGNTQGRSVRETGPRGAVLVHVADGRATRLETVTTDTARWCVIEIDASALEGPHAVATVAADRMRSEIEAAGDRLLAYRVRLVGPTPHHDAFTLHRAEIADEVQAAVQRITELAWLEKLSLATTAPERTETPNLDGFDIAAMLREATADHLLNERIGSDLAILLAKLPDTERETFDADDLAAVVAEAETLARTRLLGEAATKRDDPAPRDDP